MQAVKLTAVFLMLLHLPALAPAAGGVPQVQVAEVEAGAAAIVFSPVTELAGLSLTVTGPADYLCKNESGGGELAFELSEETIDGGYTYELRATPEIDPGILDILKEARESGDMSRVAQLRRDGKLPGEAHVQAGSFNVINGVIVLASDVEEATADVDEPPRKPVDDNAIGTGELLMQADAAAAGLGIPTKDFIILDDLIVDGSACIGTACVNGESFGTDTLRLKETTLRIKFQDTSTGPGFPSNDWQLTANDSPSGGANKFSIDDVTSGRTPFTIEAGARDHALWVDDANRIGFGTSTPQRALHAISGDTPALRLEQDASLGFTAQTWDVAGNETSFFVQDVTSGARYPFRIQPGAPSNALVIDDVGVGVGTFDPAVDLHVERGLVEAANLRLSGDSAGFDLEDNGGSVNRKVVQQFVDGGLWRLRGLNDTFTAETVTGIALDLSNGRVGIGNASSLSHPLVVGTNGTNGNGAHVTAGGVWTNGSSRAFKEGITALGAAEAMAALAELEPVRYRYILEPEEDYVGFIAEDVPELVASRGRQHLSPMDIVALLTKVVQEQQQTIGEQRRTIDDLASRVAALESGGD